jgi:alpha-L-rhamnosidase
MRRTAADGGRLVLSSGIAASRFPAERLTVPPDSEVVLRLDTGAMRAAYPRLVTSGGAGAQVDIAYAEAPYGPDGNYLPDRGDGASGRILGLTDRFLPSGGHGEVFTPFWWRAWRYAELRVKTGPAPLTLESFDRVLTGYPFETVGRFSSDDPELDRIWRIGWDTVQLDAHETYMDTAYWEQLQYVGDTRLQALVSYAVAGDPRLAAQAIEAFANSRQDGLIQSRHPAREYQSIPPFALLWVGMLHDYWMRQPDPRPVRRSLDAMRSSLDWYAGYVQPDGLVGTTPGWEFIDWSGELVNYPETRDSRETERCVVSLMYLGALRQAADLEAAIGDAARAAQFRDRAAPLPASIQAQCWSPQRRLYADQPAKSSFSQHANVLAVLYDVAPRAEQPAILERALADGKWPDAPEGVTPATYYFAFYLARALAHAGLGESYLEMLAPWRRMLTQNLTTWPETPDPTRSDSHAWSAHPTFDLLTIVAGIDTAAPGFGIVRIEPHLGPLKRLAATYAHPAGPIDADYAVQPDGSLRATVSLPPGLAGTFAWRGHDRTLAAGRNVIEIPAAAGIGVGAEPE